MHAAHDQPHAELQSIVPQRLLYKDFEHVQAMLAQSWLIMRRHLHGPAAEASNRKNRAAGDHVPMPLAPGWLQHAALGTTA
jgi:hypothetical protein